MARFAGDTRYLIEIFTRAKSLLFAHNCVDCVDCVVCNMQYSALQ